MLRMHYVYIYIYILGGGVPDTRTYGVRWDLFRPAYGGRVPGSIV